MPMARLRYDNCAPGLLAPPCGEQARPLPAAADNDWNYLNTNYISSITQ